VNVSASPAGGHACLSCQRRSWLLAQLSGPLDYLARDRDRLYTVLALSDGELIQAAAGRRKSELIARYGTFQAPSGSGDERADESLCRHDALYPSALRESGGPALLHASAGAERLAELTARPVVAIAGSAAPSDYGLTVAASLARGLAASGVTVVGRLADGIAAAAMTGALRADGAPLAFAGQGLGVTVPVRHRRLWRAITGAGCAASELPASCGGRRWGAIASERLLALLADVTVVVEALDSAAELAGARMARNHGRVLAAVPGRVTSPLSSGPNALLASGARLVGDPADVLELLCMEDEPRGRPPQVRCVELSERLLRVMNHVGAGRDTPSRLSVDGMDTGEVLLALSELEVMGLLARGDGGRYIPTEPLRGSHAALGRG
jgi:DNA processing protein